MRLVNIGRHFVQLKVKKNCKLTYEYRYPLLKLIYKALEKEDKEKAKKLHGYGYRVENKPFKLLNPILLFKNAVFNENYIQLESEDIIELMLSGTEENINLIIKNLIKTSEIELCNCKFQVVNIRQDKQIKFKRQMLYKVISQVVESTYDNRVKYLSPYQPQFYAALAQNLKRKYELIYEEEYKDEIYFDIENVLTIKKKKIQNIKEEGYRIGYGNFNIWIEASIKMQRVAYYTGLGQANMLGAGALIHLTSN